MPIQILDLIKPPIPSNPHPQSMIPTSPILFSAYAINHASGSPPERDTKSLQITQYGLSFLLRKPTCVSFEVQPVGSMRRYRATVPVRASHC
jgi:hypothetical protein